MTKSVLPPAGGSTIEIKGRVYTAADSTAIDMPDCDADLAALNGWAIVPPAIMLSIKGDKGDKGDTGAGGAAGAGVPVGGTTGQHLSKKSNTDRDTEWVTP